MKVSRRFAVGAVYDRATFASEWAKCAVIDRAYCGQWVANSYVVQSRTKASRRGLPFRIRVSVNGNSF